MNHVMYIRCGVLAGLRLRHQMAAPLKAGLSGFCTHTHTQASTHTYTSDNKGARRCFHDSELDFTASVLHEKEADIEMVG